jgi:hypothetical protein
LRGEVARLRDAAGRTMRAEAELGRLKSGSAVSTTAAVPEANTNALFAYLGEAAAPPANLDPAYSKEGLTSAIQQAAQLAGVSLTKFEIDTSEFPFLAAVVCDTGEDFEKLEAQLKKMPNYQWRESSGGFGRPTCAFNITPYRTLPSEARKRIGARTLLRTTILSEPLRAR